MRAIFSSAANGDVRKILEYYAHEVGADVALDFHSELRVSVDRLKQWPKAFPLVDGAIRRTLLRSFPFQVVYKIESATRIRILAVRHHKQNPGYGLDR